MVGAVALLVLLPSIPPGTLVDQVIAVVDKDVVTESELRIEARVALAEREGEDVAAAPLDAGFLDAFRDFLINQLLIAEQARRLGGAEVAEDEVDAELGNFQRRFRSSTSYHAFLRRFGIGSETLRRILRRNLRNDRYVRERMRLRLLGQGDPEQVDEAQYQKALRTWLGELRSAAEIRLLGPDGELERQ